MEAAAGDDIQPTPVPTGDLDPAAQTPPTIPAAAPVIAGVAEPVYSSTASSAVADAPFATSEATLAEEAAPIASSEVAPVEAERQVATGDARPAKAEAPFATDEASPALHREGRSTEPRLYSRMSSPDASSASPSRSPDSRQEASAEPVGLVASEPRMRSRVSSTDSIASWRGTRRSKQGVRGGSLPSTAAAELRSKLSPDGSAASLTAADSKDPHVEAPQTGPDDRSPSVRSSGGAEASPSIFSLSRNSWQQDSEPQHTKTGDVAILGNQSVSPTLSLNGHQEAYDSGSDRSVGSDCFVAASRSPRVRKGLVALRGAISPRVGTTKASSCSSDDSTTCSARFGSSPRGLKERNEQRTPQLFLNYQEESMTAVRSGPATCEGYVTMQLDRTSQLAYVTLDSKALCMYNDKVEVGKVGPVASFRTQDIRGVQVSNAGLSIVLDSVRFFLPAGDPAEEGRWIIALRRLGAHPGTCSLPPPPQRALSRKGRSAGKVSRKMGRILCEGTLDVERPSSFRTPMHCVLYSNGFEAFRSRPEFQLRCQLQDHGASSTRAMSLLRATLPEVRNYRVGARGFSLNCGNEVVAFSCRSKEELERWVRRLQRTFGLPVKCRNQLWGAQSSESDPVWPDELCSPKVEDFRKEAELRGVLHEGRVTSHTEQGFFEHLYLVLCPECLHVFSACGIPSAGGKAQLSSAIWQHRRWRINLGDVTAVHLLPTGFSVTLRAPREAQGLARPLVFYTPSDNELKAWALQLRTRLGNRCRATVPTAGCSPRRAASTPARPPEAPPPRAASKLRAIATHSPCCHGRLGIWHAGRLVVKYFMLFPDRLSCWDEAWDAAVGRRPFASIELSTVRSLVSVGSGFILDCCGRKIGFHAESEGDHHNWLKALQPLISPRSTSAPWKVSADEDPDIGVDETGSCGSSVLSELEEKLSLVLAEGRSGYGLQEAGQAGSSRSSSSASSLDAADLLPSMAEEALQWAAADQKVRNLAPEEMSIAAAVLAAAAEDANADALEARSGRPKAGGRAS